MYISQSQLLRAGAALLLIGGVLGLIGSLITPNITDLRQQVTSPFFVPANVLGMLGGLLTVVGLPAAYSRFARDGGWAGALGFALLMAAGIALGFFGSAMSLVVLPWIVSLPVSASVLDQGPPSFFIYFLVSGIVALVGAVLFGWVLARTRVFSAWAGYILILAGVVNLLTFFVPNLPPVLSSVGGDLFYIALGVVGYELWQQSYEAAALES